MDTSEIIELLRELETEAGEPIKVQVKVRMDDDRNVVLDLSHYDFELVPDHGTGHILIDLS